MPGARDGQLRIHRGDDSPPWCLLLYDDGAGRWRATPFMDFVPEEDSMRCIGPMTVNFSDIPGDGDTVHLFDFTAGDVLLGLYADAWTAVPWDRGTVSVGTTDDTGDIMNPGNIANANHLGYTEAFTPRLINFNTPITAHFHAGDSPATAGHVDLYAFIATPTAP